VWVIAKIPKKVSIRSMILGFDVEWFIYEEIQRLSTQPDAVVSTFTTGLVARRSPGPFH
jgi:hypothetical protein